MAGRNRHGVIGELVVEHVVPEHRKEAVQIQQVEEVSANCHKLCHKNHELSSWSPVPLIAGNLI